VVAIVLDVVAVFVRLTISVVVENEVEVKLFVVESVVEVFTVAVLLIKAVVVAIVVVLVRLTKEVDVLVMVEVFTVEVVVPVTWSAAMSTGKF